MDLVALRRLHSLLRRVLRRGPWVHPLDDHRGAVLAGSAAGRHVGGGPHQLVCKLPRGDWLPNYAGWHLRWFSIKFLHDRHTFRQCWRTTHFYRSVCSLPYSGCLLTRKFPRLKTKPLMRLQLYLKFRTNKSMYCHTSKLQTNFCFLIHVRQVSRQQYRSN